MANEPGARKSSKVEAVSPSAPLYGWGETGVCPRCKQENADGADSCNRCGFSFRETRAIDGPSGPPPESLVGKVINDKYRVISVLGEGGFGIVYKVELLLFDTANTFALKLLHPTLSQDRNFRRRFLREAGLAMALIHEHTIPIREFGQTDDGHLFFTMDYCEGEPLKTVILRERFLNVNRALHITRQILAVMKLAHSRGIVHRDIKPENVFLEKDHEGHDFVKVGDFGLAKSFGAPGDPLPGRGMARPSTLPGDDITRGGIVGTPRYMSPEQAVGRDDIDHRSDLYSIGIVLYEMLYGAVPAEKRQEGNEFAVKTPTSHPTHPVPRAVWQVIRTAIEPNRDDRYQSAEEFLAAIDELPQYTPTYLEPADSLQGRLPRWARFAAFAAMLAVLGLVGLVAKGFIEGGGVRGDVRTVAPRPLGPDTDDGVAHVGSLLVPLPPATDAVESKAATPVTTVARVEKRSSMLSPPLPGGIRAFMRFAPRDTLHYQVYREGLVADRELIYEILEEPEPGTLVVRVTPGDRTFRWIVDAGENALYQEVVLPNPVTGELQEPVRRPLLRLPGPTNLVDGDYIAGELKIHSEPITLPVPRHPKFDVFTDCLCVETREGMRTHYQYYQEGHGLVALLVYERRSPGTAGGKGEPSVSGDVVTGRAAAPSTLPATETWRPTGSQTDDVLVYARYLVEYTRPPRNEP